MNLVDVTSRLVSEAAGAALSSHGIPGGSLLTQTLLTELLHIQDEQTLAINRIDAAVTRLIDGPWETARSYLAEAQLSGRTPEQVEAALDRAADKLHEAVPLQAADTFPRAYVCLDLALVLRMTGDAQAAALHAPKGLAAACGYVRGVASGQNRPANYASELAGARVAGGTAAYFTYGLNRVVGNRETRMSRFDGRCNGWLREVYGELEMIEQAVALLVRTDDQGVEPPRCTAPRGMEFRAGKLRHSADRRRALLPWRRGLGSQPDVIGRGSGTASDG